MGAPDPRKPNVTTVGGKINILEARKFWSFQPPKVVAPAAVKNTAWPKSEIDKYLLAALEAKNLSPVGDADRATLIRRAYFDVVGLPPTPEQIDAFVNDADPKAFEAVVDDMAAAFHGRPVTRVAGIESRGRALVSSGDAAEDAYKESIGCLTRTPLRPELARSHLLYGE